MVALRIFSYLPNPRVAKATIAARLTGVEVELRGARPDELSGWLWDYDARAIAPGEEARFADLGRTAKTGFTTRLFKTDRFLAAHPFGTVPAAFGPEGEVGIFESNSIMRAVARLGEDKAKLYGTGPYDASRIDSFLDVTLVFACQTQVYLLSLRGGHMTAEIRAATESATTSFLGGIERALEGSAFIAGPALSLADIAFAAEIALLHNELDRRETLEKAGFAPLLGDRMRTAFPRTFAHFDGLRAHPAFAPDLEPYLNALGVPAIALAERTADS